MLKSTAGTAISSLLLTDDLMTHHDGPRLEWAAQPGGHHYHYLPRPGLAAGTLELSELAQAPSLSVSDSAESAIGQQAARAPSQSRWRPALGWWLAQSARQRARARARHGMPIDVTCGTLWRCSGWPWLAVWPGHCPGLRRRRAVAGFAGPALAASEAECRAGSLPRALILSGAMTVTATLALWRLLSGDSARNLPPPVLEWPWVNPCQWVTRPVTRWRSERLREG